MQRFSWSPGPHRQTELGDAKLMRAAPELLEVCKNFLAEVQRGKVSRSTLLKAEYVIDSAEYYRGVIGRRAFNEDKLI